jgi:hypothetical protein
MTANGRFAIVNTALIDSSRATGASPAGSLAKPTWNLRSSSTTSPLEGIVVSPRLRRMQAVRR